MVRIFRGGVLDERFEGSVVVIGPRSTTMTGLVRGDLFVRDNSLCDVTGMVSGNLLAERSGKAVLHGLVTKAAKAAGGDLEIYGMVQGDVVNEGGRLYVDKGAEVLFVRRAAHPEAACDALGRDLARRAVVAVPVGLQQRVALFPGEVTEQAVHPDARREDGEGELTLPNELGRTPPVEVAEQVAGPFLVEGDHAEVAPAVLEHGRRRLDRLVRLPDVPGAVPVRAGALEHEDAGVRGLDPLVDALARLPDLLLDVLEDRLVQSRDLHELPVPDAPHRDREAGMAARDLHERVVVLGPKRDLPEAHAASMAVAGDIGDAVIRRQPKAG